LKSYKDWFVDVTSDYDFDIEIGSLEYVCGEMIKDNLIYDFIDNPETAYPGFKMHKENYFPTASKE